MSCTYKDMPDCLHTHGVACKLSTRECDKCGFDPDVQAYRIAKLMAEWQKEAEHGKKESK